jgi:hypothetical protein
MYGIGFQLKETKTDYLPTGCGQHAGCGLGRHVDRGAIGGEKAGKGEFGYVVP